MIDIPARELDALHSYLTIKRWIRDKSESTCYTYLRNMVHFKRETSLDPDQFLAWAKTVESVEVQDRIEEVAESIRGVGARFNFKTDMRSFLAYNGYNNLPRRKNVYTPTEWHRGYRKEEVRKLLGYLDTPIHKLFVYLAAESGLRAQTLLSLKYKHIKEDLEAGVLPVAIRLGPEYYGKKKSAGFTFLGARTVSLLRESITNRLITTDSDSPLVPSVKKERLGKPGSYSNMHEVLVRAAKKSGLDSTVQPAHGLRKYFENMLDQAGIDSEQKMMIEGHFEGTRAKNYTDREWESLRPVYAKAYPFIDVDAGNPDLEQKVFSWQQEKLLLEQKLETATRRVEALEEEKKNRRSEIEDIRRDLQKLREEMESKRPQ